MELDQFDIVGGCQSFQGNILQPADDLMFLMNNGLRDVKTLLWEIVMQQVQVAGELQVTY